MADRAHVARLQRQRRARITRIDYMPGPEALAVIAAKRTKERPGSVAATNSAVIDSIVREWERLTGEMPPRARVYKTGGQSPELLRTSRARAGARYDSGGHSLSLTGSCDHSAHARMTSGDANAGINRQVRTHARMSPVRPLRVTCGAKRHRDGKPCEAKSEPGKRRCRFHGGRSTGPRTPEGRAKALLNLRRGRRA